MATYIIGYDLTEPGRDYADLTKAIQAYGAYCHLQKSVWLIVSEVEAAVIRENLKRYLDSNDKLFIAKVSAPAAWTENHGDKISEWLRTFL